VLDHQGSFSLVQTLSLAFLPSFSSLSFFGIVDNVFHVKTGHCCPRGQCASICSPRKTACLEK
jgi:hypothetical protein